MKKLLLSAFVAFAMLASTKTLAQQGFGTNTPDKSAAVDIVSSKRGLLIPRLALTETTDQAPIPLSIAPATSLFVYNTATVNDVIPGFYYWDGAKWVRFVSSSTEKNVVVTAGKNVEVNSAVSTDGLTTTYTVGVAEGDTNGQVLVTKETSPGVFTSEWVNPDDFIKGVNGINVTTDAAGNTNVGLGGALDKNTNLNTTGFDFAITGLPTLTAVTSEKVMVMDASGILKQVSLSDLLAAKDLTLGDGLNFEAGIAGNDGVGAVLKATKIEIGDKSVTSEKLVAATDGSDENKIPVANLDGSVEYKDASTAIGKALTTDNIIGVGADATAASATTANLLNGAVLTPTYLKIKDDAITATQIAENAVGASELADNSVASGNIIDGEVKTADIANLNVTSEKLVAATDGSDENKIPVANADGSVEYKTFSAALGETLTTDGKITVVGGTTATTMDNSVLVPTSIAIAANSITSTDIKDGTIQASDLKAPGTTTDSNTGGTANQMLVTDSSGNVSWQPQSGVAMAGDVTGTTGANEISKLQGVNLAAKDANAPANGEVLTYDDSTKAWTPKTVAEAAGKELSTDGVIVIGANASATATSAPSSILADVKLNIGTDKITATHIAENAVTASELADNSVASANIIDGSVQAADIQAPNSLTNTGGTVNQVMVTNSSGDVAWVNQSDLANKDNYTFATPLAKSAGTANATGGLDFNVTIATASATTLGVVKQSAATGEEITIAADGSLSVNESNVVLSGDVTGPLNDTKVGAIQGTAVSATAPTANQVMTFNNTTNEWTPTAPTSLVLVDNGISKATDGDIILGGTLNEAATTIITGGATNTLAVQALVVPTAATAEVMYAEGSTGILRKAIRSISQYIEASQTVNTISGYNDFVQEVNITAKIVSGDINVTLPNATATNKGQVINIKIVNTAEVDDYLNILVGSTTLTYGALPYQSWIIKSNGSTWEVVGRN